MSDQAKREVRAAFWTRLFAVVVFAFLVFNSAAVTFLNVQDSERIQQNRRIQQTIRDCVTPDGECYRDNQRQRATTVREINHHSVLAAACAVVVRVDDPVEARVEAIAECIREQLDR